MLVKRSALLTSLAVVNEAVRISNGVLASKIGPCQTVGVRLEVWTTPSKSISEADCASLCEEEVRKLPDWVGTKDWNDLQVSMLRSTWHRGKYLPTTLHPVSIDVCSTAFRFCVRPWSALVSALHNRDSRCQATPRGQQCGQERCLRWNSRLEGRCSYKGPTGISCYCTAFLVIPKLCIEPPKNYPTPGISCNHEKVCERLSRRLVGFGAEFTRWVCGRSVVLIEEESCAETGDKNRPSPACPCTHNFQQSRRTRKYYCEDWSLNEKVLQLFDTPAILARDWSNYVDKSEIYGLDDEAQVTAIIAQDEQTFQDLWQSKLERPHVFQDSRPSTYQLEPMAYATDLHVGSSQFNQAPIYTSVSESSLQRSHADAVNLAAVGDLSATQRLSIETLEWRVLNDVNNIISPEQMLSIQADELFADHSMMRQARLSQPVNLPAISMPMTGSRPQPEPVIATAAVRGQKRSIDDMLENAPFPRFQNIPARLGIDDNYIELANTANEQSRLQEAQFLAASSRTWTRNVVTRVENFNDLVSVSRPDPASVPAAAAGNDAGTLSDTEAEWLKRLLDKGKSPML